MLLGLLLRAAPGRPLRAAVVSSLLFAGLHYANLLRGQPLDDTHGQVLTAFFAGLFLAGLFMRTQNILVPILCHALFDAGVGTAALRPAHPPAAPAPLPTDDGLLTTLGVVLLLLGAGYLMIRRSQQAAFQRGLSD
ncbi:CPBP family intramembrane glutamic endopeptidase [Hymenobacter gummosus]|uniref:CPBP family intramembrane glutamic endopeptidase n=1 Tax=Hymenobacter gummosus TaxID=1776032 RepID=UPI0014042D47|nr:CPBP family intramembrane glutamic endopeptidase [Hymenobacter gummosus]